MNLDEDNIKQKLTNLCRIWNNNILP